MKIAFVSPNYEAYSETFIATQIKILNNENVIHYHGDHIPDKIGSLNIKDVVELKGKFLELKNQYKRYSKLIFFRGTLQKENVDLAVCQYGQTAAKCLPAIRSLNIPLIIHFHGYDASKYEVLRSYKQMYKNAFDYAYKVICVSEKMRSDLIEAGCPEKKLILLTYAPKKLFYKNNPAFLKKEFIAVGRFVAKKAPHLTIIAFKDILDKHPDAKLFMYGDGPLLNRCKKIVKEYNLESNIFFMGAQSHEVICEQMQKSCALVQHSITSETGDSEGTPVCVLEASAAAIPIVATRHAGIIDVVLENETGFLVDEYDVASMSKALSQIADNLDGAKKMGEKARERIIKYYDYELYSKKILKLFHETKNLLKNNINESESYDVFLNTPQYENFNFFKYIKLSDENKKFKKMFIYRLEKKIRYLVTNLTKNFLKKQ